MGLFNCFRSRPIILLFIAAIVTLSSFMTFFLMPTVIKKIIAKTLPLINSPTSLTFDKWENIPLPIVTKFYLFNITNPEEVEKHGRPPIIEELGPYTYEETRKKVDITWTEDLDIVNYGQLRRWKFIPELTNGSLDDPIYHLNIPMVAAGSAVKGRLLPAFALNGMISATGSHLITLHTADQLLFSGYDDPLITVARTFGVDVPHDKFGWFYGRNDTVSDGTFGVFTGAKDLSNYDQMVSWNGHKTLPLWWGDECNSLQGVSASDFQLPFQEFPAPTMKIFVGDTCRSLELAFEKDILKHGLKGFRYTVDSNLFNYTIDKNRCYCKNNACPPNGVADISPCTHGSPAAISLPHFLFGDATLFERVHGLEPDPSKHEFYMDVEPTLGIPMKVKVAMQINALLERAEFLSYSEKLPFDQTYYPMIWFSAEAELDISMASQLWIVQNIVLILHVVTAVQATIVIIVLCIMLIFYRSQLCSSGKHHLVPSKDEDSNESYTN